MKPMDETTGPTPITGRLDRGNGVDLSWVRLDGREPTVSGVLVGVTPTEVRLSALCYRQAAVLCVHRCSVR